jgi:hypothetical protein
MVVSLNENNCFFVTHQTPLPKFCFFINEEREVLEDAGFSVLTKCGDRATRLGEFSPLFWATIFFGQVFKSKEEAHFKKYF